MTTFGEIKRDGKPQKREMHVLKPPTVSARFSFQNRRVPRVGAILPTPEERQAALEEFKQFKADVAASMYDCVQNVRSIEAMSRDEAELYTEELDQSRAAIKEMLSYTGAERLVSVVSYADAKTKTCPKTKGAVETTLFELLSVGFLSEAKNNNSDIRAYGKKYNLSPEFTKTPESTPIIGEIENLLRETTANSRRVFEESFDALSRLAGSDQISVEELKSGKEGRILLFVPDNEVNNRFYKGGYILVESRSGIVKLVGAVSGPQRTGENVARYHGFVPVSSLDQNRLVLETKVGDEQFKACCILQTWLRLAIGAAEEEADKENRKKAFAVQVEAERQELIPKATISFPEFVLSEKTGLAFVDFGRKPFEIRNGGPRPKLVWEVFAVVERSDKGLVRVAFCPERLNEFFAENLEFRNPGQEFRNLGRLGQILRKKVGEIKNSNN